jgi:hypothetical protein
MKNFIKINPTSFILGAVLGGLIIFTIGADSQHTPAWNYIAIEKKLSVKPPFLDYTGALNQTAAENKGSEIVSSQFFPGDDTLGIDRQDTVKIVLRIKK